MNDHTKNYSWLARKLEKIFPFKGEYIRYGDDDPVTPAQIAEGVVMAVILSATFIAAVTLIVQLIS